MKKKLKFPGSTPSVTPQQIILAAVLAVLILFIFEGLLIITRFRIDFIAPEYDIPMQVDPDILFINKPSSRDDIDGNGFRRVYKQAPATESDARVILFLGDTETFGYGVSYHEAFPAVAAQELGDRYHVKNLGVVGYGPDQSWLQLKRYLSNFPRPAGIVLTLAAANDFEDLFRNNLISTDFSGNTNINKINTVSALYPRFRIVLFGRAMFRGQQSFPYSMYRELLADRPGLLSDLPVEEADRRKVLLFKALQEITTLAADDIPILVTIVPPLCKGKWLKVPICSSNIFEIARIAEAAELPFYNLFKVVYLHNEDPHISFMPRSGHLTGTGHQRVGKRLGRVIPRLLFKKNLK